MKTKTFIKTCLMIATISIGNISQAAHMDVSGLIHLWEANGNTIDSVGSANGTLGADTAYAAGLNGQAFDFSGSNSTEMTLPVNISPSNLPQMTMGMFINVQSIANSRGWVMGHGNHGYDRSLIISDRRYGFGLAAGIGSSYTSSLPKLADNLGDWYGIAVSYDQVLKTATVYINDLMGNSSIQTLSTGLNDGRTEASVGGLSQFNNHGVDALVDDVFIYDRALTKSQLDRVFSEVPAPSTIIILSLALISLIRFRNKSV